MVPPRLFRQFPALALLDSIEPFQQRGHRVGKGEAGVGAWKKEVLPDRTRAKDIEIHLVAAVVKEGKLNIFLLEMNQLLPRQHSNQIAKVVCR